jgi:hypothetical protein
MRAAEAQTPTVARATRIGLALGVIGLVACAAGLVLDRGRFFPAYLAAFVFWAGLSLGLLVVTLMHHLVRGSWGFPIQRIVEAGARTLPLMAVLFLPLLLGLAVLYPWANPQTVSQNAVLAQKAGYLNAPFFAARTVVYFAVWIFLAYRVSALSWRLDRTGDPATIVPLRLLGTVGLLLMVLTMTFATIDWVMSLEPDWYSSIYGLMVGMGMVQAAFALAIFLVVRFSRREPLASAVSAQTYNDLGSLLLAFVMLWAYLAYSQYMLIWAGNISEEIPWYLRRLYGGWNIVAWAVLILNFAVPFFLLIFRDVKRQGQRLAAIALFLVIMRVVDVVWLVLPAFGGPALISLLWCVAALLGIGGLWAAFFAWQLGRAALLPAYYPRPSEGHGLASGAIVSPETGPQTEDIAGQS